MALTRPSAWADLERTDVSLDDVLGVPGLAREEALAALSEPLGGAADLVPASADALVVVASRPARTVGAFARRDDEALASVASALPRLSAGSAAVERIATVESQTGRHVVAQQRIRGAKVVGGRFTIHLDASGPFAVTGSPVGDVGERDPGPEPATTEADARAAIAELFPGGRTVTDVERVVFPTGGTAVWAWHAVVAVDQPEADVRVFLAADDLRRLASYVLSVASLFGEATVYPVNPLRTPAVEPVCLRGIGPAPEDRLEGAAVRVAVRTGNPFANPLRDWRIEPGDAGFDEASAYHHVSNAYDWFSRLARGDLFTRVPFTPLTVVVRDQGNPDNASYHPGRGELSFGDFAVAEGPRPSARSADMVLHEFAHAVSHAIARLADTNQKQALGLGEGYSDYFACSALGDPAFGDYVTDTPGGARRCERPGLRLEANPDGMEEHALGEIWANVLWGIRSRVGRTIADHLAIESLYYLQPGPTLERARFALQEVDRILFPDASGTTGRHAAIIDEEYDERF